MNISAGIYWAFFLACLLINIITLHDGHNWGGDFAQYILHAKNMLSNHPYAGGIMLEKTIVYPPGFPLLLSPLINIWGINFLILKSLNIFFWAGSVVFCYLLSKKHGDRTIALLSAMILSASSVLFTFKQNILSDLPFLFLVLGAIYFMEGRFWLLGMIFLYQAMLTRSAGFALCAGAAIYYLWIMPDNRKVISLILFTLAAWITQLWITQGIHPAFFTAAFADMSQFAHSLYQALPTLWQSLAWFLTPGQTPITSWAFFALSCMAAITAPALWLWLGYWSILKLRTKDLTLMECFSICYACVLLVWSLFGDSPQQFNRFVFPLAALLPAIIRRHCKTTFQQHVIRAALIGALLINMLNTATLINFNDDDLINAHEQRTMLEWVRSETSANEHFMIWEPRTVTLMTGRVGTTLAWLVFNPLDQWPAITKRMGISIVILTRDGDKDLIPFFLSRPAWAKRIWENKHYLIIRIIS